MKVENLYKQGYYDYHLIIENNRAQANRET